MTNTNTALATITPQEWPMVLEQANMLVKTGFLPYAIKTPEQAIAIMMKARELQIPPMYGLSNIAVIQGKPAANAELMLALIYRDQGDQAIQFQETTGARCVVQYKRKGWPAYKSHTYTIEQARAAKLTGDNWTKYPDAMLRARCISAVARMAFPDSIGGMYTPEELGADVDPETGNIVDVTPAPPAQLLPPHDADTGEILDVTPVALPEPTPIKPPATQEQLVEIRHLMGALGILESDLLLRVERDNLEELTTGQASKLTAKMQEAWEAQDKANMEPVAPPQPAPQKPVQRDPQAPRVNLGPEYNDAAWQQNIPDPPAPERDELDEAFSGMPEPERRAVANPTPIHQPLTGKGDLATEKQVKAIRAIGRATLHLKDNQLDDWCMEHYGCLPDQLSKTEASTAIDAMKAQSA